MPPDLRNHLEPTGGDTPASRAASSLERPVAIAAQNRTSSSRRAESGRPGECNLLRPDQSDRRLRTVIATSYATVLRRPIELATVAIGEVMGGKPPDIVFTGVNRGMNVGEDVTYSGTVSAAMEATLLGVPAIAFSLEVAADHPAKWATAEHFAPGIIRDLTRNAWPEDVFMNVNIPNLIATSVKGVRAVSQGQHEAENSIIKLTDPRGNWYYWIGPSERRKVRVDRNSDYDAIANGFIAVTPLHVDLTHRGMLRTLKKALL